MQTILFYGMGVESTAIFALVGGRLCRRCPLDELRVITAHTGPPWMNL